MIIEVDSPKKKQKSPGHLVFLSILHLTVKMDEISRERFLSEVLHAFLFEGH